MRNEMNALERETCTIIVNGVKMTMAQYKKQLKEVKKAANGTTKSVKRKKKAEKKEVPFIAQEVEKMLKPIKALKSFSAYYDHAYRQWGTVAEQILNLRTIKRPFVAYRSKIRDLDVIIADIDKISRKNDKDIFQYFEKLSWKLDDIKSDIRDIVKATNESGVCQQFKNHECINGKGKRLGLQTLIFKASKAIDELENVIRELNNIISVGADVMNYGQYLSLNQRRKLL